MEKELELLVLSEMDCYYERMNACESTSGRSYNFKKMLALYEQYECIRSVWNYVSEAYRIVKRFVKKTAEAILQKEKESSEKRQLFYLVRFLDSNGNLIWSKIGTTTRSIKERMKEHMRKYKKQGFDVATCDVQKVWDCGKIPAEGLESEFRASYVRRFPNLYVKTDRFKMEFDYQEAEQIVLNYLAANT